MQHAWQADIGAIFGATGDFVYSIMSDWTGANHFEFVFLLRFHTHLHKDYEARRIKTIRSISQKKWGRAFGTPPHKTRSTTAFIPPAMAGTRFALPPFVKVG